MHSSSSFLASLESRTHAGGGTFHWQLPQPETAPVPSLGSQLFSHVEEKDVSTNPDTSPSAGTGASPDEAAAPQSSEQEQEGSGSTSLSPDWYNMTAIGRDEPLDKNMSSSNSQRPSMRRSVSGGSVTDRSAGDATTPAAMGRHKSAGHLTLEDEVTGVSAASGASGAGAVTSPHTRSRSFSGSDRISLTGAGKYVHLLSLTLLSFLTLLATLFSALSFLLLLEQLQWQISITRMLSKRNELGRTA
jgi:hypothetical protein